METKKSFYTEFVEFVIDNADGDVSLPELLTGLDRLKILEDEGKLVILTTCDELGALSGVLAFFLVPPIAGFNTWKEIESYARPFTPDQEQKEIAEILSILFSGNCYQLSGIAIPVVVVRKDRRQTKDLFLMFNTLKSLTEKRFFVPIYYAPQPLEAKNSKQLLDLLGFELIAIPEVSERDWYYAAPADKVNSLV